MNAKQISRNVYALHTDICHSPLFEGIWPIPNGVTLNSYIVRGEKTALIDLVRDWENAPEKTEEQMESLGISFKNIDYLILNHLEPDHTGFIRSFKEINPHVQIISTQKGINLVQNFFKITDNLRAVKMGDTLDLGGGTVLDFIEIPNVHWPETMATYERESMTLFTCDAFGSYGKTESRIFDDEFTPEEHLFFEQEALRYYANIVASFSTAVKSALEKISAFTIKTVAPSHGLIWRKDPHTAIDRYARYARYNTGGPMEKEICVIWGSMYGNTKTGVDAVIEGITAEGVRCTALEIPATDVSAVLAKAYPAAGLVIAMPTYEYKMFPPMAQVLSLFGRKLFTGKTVLRIGSWGWVGGAKKEYDETTASFKWDHIEPYEWQGVPMENDLAVLKERGRELAKAVADLTA